jgi:hypothetical protein
MPSDVSLKLQRFANFRKEERGFTTLAFGHAGRPKVLRYDLGALVRKGAFSTVYSSKASVFTLDSSLATSQMLYMFWFVLTGALAYTVIPIEHLRRMQEFEEFTNYWNVFIPFILGLYIALNMSRWWILRTEGLGRTLDAVQNVVLLMNGIFPGGQWGDVHDQVLKYGLASISLIVNACRGNEDVESLGPKGDNLFTLEEMEVVSSVHCRARPALMWTWILMLLSRICGENNVYTGKFRDIASECTKARDGISVIWSYLRTQLPFAYVHLVTFMVNLNNFFVSIKCGILFSLAVREQEPSRAFSQCFFVCIVPPLYQALLTIAFIIHDPFGEDLLDFPVMAFQEYMNETAVSMTSMGCRCPALTTFKDYPATSAFSSTCSAPTEVKRNVGGTVNGSQGLNLDDVISDAVNKYEKASVGQMNAKDEVIGMLRERAQWLESSLSALSGRLQMLERRSGAIGT